MTVGRKTMMAGLDPARCRKIGDRVAELVAEEMTLCELRKTRQRSPTGRRPLEVESLTHAHDDTPIRFRCPSTLALNAFTSRSRTGNGCA